MSLRWRRCRDLADRLRPYVLTREPAETTVDADPIRMFLYRWMIETGDPIETIATGFDLGPELVRALVSGDLRRLRASQAFQVRKRLGLLADLESMPTRRN